MKSMNAMINKVFTKANFSLQRVEILILKNKTEYFYTSLKQFNVISPVLLKHLFS